MRLGSTFKDSRTNEAWVCAVRGDHGLAEQKNAHQELLAYLFTTALNYMWVRRPTVNLLAQHGNEEIAAWAEDFVQQFSLKLIKDDYALLEKYNGHGRFLAWSAQVLRNIIATELRRRAWQCSERLDEKTVQAQARTSVPNLSCPDIMAQTNQLVELIEKVLADVSFRNRTIFLRYVIDGERANVVADDLGMSAGGVYTSAHRMREMVGKVLTDAGFV